MSNSDKTTEINNKVILEAVNKLSEKIDDLKSDVGDLKSDVGDLKNDLIKLENHFNGFEKFANAQFEAIRQGISANSAAFDRLEARFHENRSEILNFRADMKDMHEDIRRWKKEMTKSTLELK